MKTMNRTINIFSRVQAFAFIIGLISIFQISHAQTLYITGGSSDISSTTDYSHTRRLGMGTSAPKAKFHVINKAFDVYKAAKIEHIMDLGTYITKSQTALDVSLVNENGKRGLYGISNLVNNKYTSGGATATGLWNIIYNFSDNTGKAVGINTLGYGGAEGVGIRATGVGKFNYSKVYGIVASASAPGADTKYDQTWAGYFAGDVFVGGSYVASDRQLKRNFKNPANVLSQIRKVNVKQYDYKSDSYKRMHLPEETQVGFIAQNLEEVFPNLVKEIVAPSLDSATLATGLYDHEKELSFKGVNYVGMVPYLTQAIQEQQIIIDRQEEELQKLKVEMEEIKQQMDQLASTTIFSRPTSSQNTKSQLLANYPNPAQTETHIPFVLAEGIHQATIIVRDIETAQILSRIAISDSDLEDAILSTQNFRPGAYSYSLEVEGKIVDSKIFMIE